MCDVLIKKSLSVFHFVAATERRMLTLLAEMKAELKEEKKISTANSRALSELLQPGPFDLKKLSDDFGIPTMTCDQLKDIQQ